MNTLINSIIILRKVVDRQFEMSINTINQYKRNDVIDFSSKEKKELQYLESLFDKKDYQVFIKKSIEFLDKYRNNTNNTYLLRGLRSRVFLEQEEWDKALIELNNTIEFIENNYPDSRDLLFDDYGTKGQLLARKSHHLEAVKYMSVEAFYNKKISSEFLDLLEIEYLKFIEKEFFIISKERKLIFLSNCLCDIYNLPFTVLLFDKLPDINFSEGKLVIDKLYINHPLKSNTYLPFSSYKNILLNERTEEVLRLLRFWGANQIFIEEKNEIKEIKYEIKPLSTNESLWFNHEPKWQEFHSKRINTGVLKSSIKLSIDDLEEITNEDKARVINSMKNHIRKINNGLLRNTQKNIDLEYQNKTMKEIIIHVGFDKK